MNGEPYSLEDRTTRFSKEVISFCKYEKLTFFTRPILERLLRSATSIGANYAEANNAASKTDFRNKIFIAKKEAAETKYWLTLLLDFAEDKPKCSVLLKESHYLLMTFQKIVNTLSQSKQKTVNAR